MYAKKNSSVKAVALLLCMALLIGGAIGGTLAYLMTKSDPVVNTFTVGNIGTLTLTETKPANKSAIVTPGVNIEKDPTVTFSGNNVAAYVFVAVDADDWEFDRTNDVYTYSCIGEKVSWTVADGWNKLDGVVGDVYYRTVEADTADDEDSFAIIAGNSVAVDKTILQSHLTNANVPNLTFTAYAVQKDNMADAAAAWAVAKNNGAPVNP